MFLSLVLFFYRYQYIRYIKEWSWVCIKCGKEQIGERKNYCQICSGEMTLKIKKRILKYCENGHRIIIKDELEYNVTDFCPKCGKPFVETKVEVE